MCETIIFKEESEKYILPDKNKNSNFVYHKSEPQEKIHLKMQDLIILVIMIFSLMLLITLVIIRQHNHELFLDYLGLKVMLYSSISLFVICFIYQIVTKLIKRAK